MMYLHSIGSVPVDPNIVSNPPMKKIGLPPVELLTTKSANSRDA
jgi:hypothetical protein